MSDGANRNSGNGGKQSQTVSGSADHPDRIKNSTHSSSTENAIELCDLDPHKHNTIPSKGSSNGNSGRRKQGRVELPVIDTDVIRRTNVGGSQSMPPSPTSAALSSSSLLSPPKLAAQSLQRQLSQQKNPLAAAAGGAAGHVKSGRMTKIPHYGRLRSVTARVLRIMDPRTLANQLKQQQQKQQKLADESAIAGAGAGVAGMLVEDGGGMHGNTAAGVLGQSVVDTVRDATAAGRRKRRHSYGSMPLGTLLSLELAQRNSFDRGASSAQRWSRSLSRQPTRGSHVDSVSEFEPEAESLAPSEHRFLASEAQSIAGGLAQAAAVYDSIIAIPMPGFFLDAASDEWTGGHSFRQRMRYPDEDIAVPASLTKRVHYEVSYDYPKNVISTARYNVVTFLPAQLAAQFSKVANIYFLFIAALQQVPGWSTTGRWSTVLPLCVFVSLSIAHEGFDDLRRHRMDRAENTQRTRVLKVKVHDRERVSFRLRELRSRGSHSIHSFRMRSSQSIHDIGRNTLDGARRWASNAIGIGSTIKQSIVSRMAEKRRKQRELEDSDDEDEQPAAAGAGDNAEGQLGDDDAAAIGEYGAESLLRRRITRGVMSLRSLRTATQWGGDSQAATPTDATATFAGDSSELVDNGDDGDGDTPNETQLAPRHQRQASRAGGASLAMSGEPICRRRGGPMVAFNDVVEEMSFDGDADDSEQIINPLPENMSCRWKNKRWENVQVGDLMKIQKDEWIPADCIVIASTGFDGTCFVETAALDGETTLKQKQALDATNSEIQTPEQLAAFNAFTYVEPPSPELYNFEGYMEIDSKRFPLTPNQLLLRGSVLRNTAYVFVQVVYSGEQTRLRLNATRNVRTKAPQIQRITNRIVILVFALLLVLCFIFSALGITWNNSGRNGHWYLDGMRMPATALIFGYLVMMNALIPISLYVTLEAVKIFQCWFIQQDLSMYHAESDTRAEARTTAINEDLGMVRYVFSDKTGTLTENIMKLRAVMVAGFSYLHVDLDRLQQQAKDSSAAATNPLTGEAAFSANDQQGAGSGLPNMNRSTSKLSFLRPSTPSQQQQGTSGRQSPSIFKSPIFMREHRRQHSMPVSMLDGDDNQGGLGQGQGGMGQRTLQQLALTNRVASGGSSNNGLRPQFARHMRGLSASVLRMGSNSNDKSSVTRTPLTSPFAIVDDDDSKQSEEAEIDPAEDPRSIKLEERHSQDDHTTTGDAAHLEASLGDNSREASDPDIAMPGSDSDPRMHTLASDDAPVSDLQKLPSSRRIMDSIAVPSEVFRARAEWFLRCIALCHTVQPDRDPLTGRITGYQAISPDEKALVAAAAELGYVMNNRAGPLVQLRVVASERMRDFNSALVHGLMTPTEAPLSTPSNSGGNSGSSGGSTRQDPSTLARKDAQSTAATGETAHVSFADAPPSSPIADSQDAGDAAAGMNSKDADAESFDRGVPAPDPTDRLGNYEVLDVLEFSSARKRMSVIYRCPDGRIVMMSKGADSAIWPRLLKTDRIESKPGDVSFMPRPSAPERVGGGSFAGFNGSWLPLRRKLSHPSAAYLHSRNSSVASANNLDVMRLGGQQQHQQQVPESGVSPRALARLVDTAQHQPRPRTLSGLSLATGLDFSNDYVQDQLAEYGQLKTSAEAAAASVAGGSGALAALRPFRPAHRRLMSDSQFSAVSDASSFGDTQGHVEVPDAFGQPSREEEEWTRAKALEALHQFSTEGLRTLAYAHKEISESAYESWHQRYMVATTALVSRQQQVEAVCEEIEGDLLLSGVSAIEDRLQAGVPETIFKLRRAGIRVWMLTGDKVETAINIAKSCRLIDTDVVETTKMDERTELGDRMTLLVMQSMTDRGELDRILSQALTTARAMAATATVDQRFESRSRMEKLRRGMKRFGGFFVPSRVRSRADACMEEPLLSEDNNSRLSKSPAIAAEVGHHRHLDQNAIQHQGHGQGQQPIAGGGGAAAAAAAVSEVGWADDVQRGATPTTLLGLAKDSRAKRTLSISTDVSSQASDATRAAAAASKQPTINNANAVSEPKSQGASLAVVIDGETLATIEESGSGAAAEGGLLDKFLTLGTLCDAVICSRVSPSQKALIVHNMRVRCERGSSPKTHQGWWARATQLLRHDNDRYMVTLAIGDGGNDIAMIQEAHVGIGIAGQEGLQASRAADFSIGQFRFLQKLLLVHGRWSYVRVSMFIMGTFYKCMSFYLAQLIFQFYTGFSGTSLFESWTLSMYNTLFSILPVLVVGIFEQDLRPETLLAYPELYRDMGPRNHLFTVPLFMRRVMVIGVLHSVVAAYFPFATGLFLGENASSDDMFTTGFVVYSIMVLVVTLKIAYLDVRRWVVFSHISVVVTLLVWFGWNGVLAHVYPPSSGDGYIVLGTFLRLMRQGNFWFQWIIFAAIALSLNVLIMLVYNVRDPVEHRVTSWVAFERKQEHERNRLRRQAWLQSKGAFGRLVGGRSMSPPY